MNSSRSSASQFFDSYAHDFDAIYAGGRSPIHQWLSRQLRRSMFLRYARSLRACAPIEGATILDVGCGPGHYAIALARMGAAKIVGIDVSPAMLEVANAKARTAGVEDRCQFVSADFLEFSDDERFDFVILMGFMDYIGEAQPVLDKAISHAKHKAMFSFPVRAGFLAWQRRIRYRSKTSLYMYALKDLEQLLNKYPDNQTTTERIARDYFVTVDKSL